MSNYDDVKKYRTEKPWVRPREYARRRCLDKKHRAYSFYGGRGIQFQLTISETKTLFFRDKAFLMVKPSLDRIDPDGHYCFENCRFLELKENVERKRPPGFAKENLPDEWED